MTIEKTPIEEPLFPPHASLLWSVVDYGASKHGEARQIFLTPGGEPSIDVVGDRERYTYRNGAWYQNRGAEKIEGGYALSLTRAWNALVRGTIDSPPAKEEK